VSTAAAPVQAGLDRGCDSPRLRSGFAHELQGLVVAVDSSEAALGVVSRAAILPVADGARTTVLTVAGLGTFGVSMSAHATAEQAAWARAATMAEYTRALVERRRVRGRVRVTASASAGVPALEIVREAEKARADLIVIGRRRERSLVESVVGPTTERLIRKTRTPVLVVSGAASGGYQRPLVAVDFSDGSKRVVESALRLLPSAKGPVHLVHVAHFEDGADDDTLRRRAISLFEPIGRGVDWRVEVRRGDQRAALLDVCRETGADLLVLGSRHQPFAQRLLGGSAAASLARVTPCDTLIVPIPSQKEASS